MLAKQNMARLTKEPHESLPGHLGQQDSGVLTLPRSELQSVAWEPGRVSV